MIDQTLAATRILVGLYYGDEGKGKVVDFLAPQYNYVVRFQGGPNAGHTLKVNGQTIILHSLPSGILYPQVTCLISAGVVLDLEDLYQEIKKLKSLGYLQHANQLLISDKVALILPFSKDLEAAREQKLGKQAIGSTLRAIGPTYEDRASRKALLFGDLCCPETLRAKLEDLVYEKNCLFQNLYGLAPIDLEPLLQRLQFLASELAPHHLTDVSLFVNRALSTGQKIFFEGAQGTYLDNFHGTYPFVTSSSTLAANACVSAGFSPKAVDSIMGVVKAYSTRVGSGPFVVELTDEIGQKLQSEGAEFGSTTGRPRRCGWLDLPAIKQAVIMNGVTEIALTKLDVLAKFPEVRVCVDYRLSGRNLNPTCFPPDFQSRRADLEITYKSFPSWPDISQCYNFADLPLQARNYVEFIEQYLEVPVKLISIGAEREQTICRL